MELFVIGIDPGPEQSALVMLDQDYVVRAHDYDDNLKLCQFLESLCSEIATAPYLAIEMVTRYGANTGESVFNTAKAIGWFERSFRGLYSSEMYNARLYLYLRSPIRSWFGVRKKASMGAPLKDRFGEAKKGHPLEGITKHKWDALAVAVYHLDGLKMALAKDKPLSDFGFNNVMIKS